MVQFSASVNQTKIWARSMAWVFVAGLLSLPAQAKLDDKDLFDRMVLDPTLKTFVRLIVKADMIEAIKAEGPNTIFAPNDAAFAKLSPQTLEALKKDKALLRKTLNLHIVSGKVLTRDLKTGTLKTLSGGVLQVTLKVSVPPVLPTIGGAKFVTPDAECSNGVLQVVDAILITAGKSEKGSPTKPLPPH